MTAPMLEIHASEWPAIEQAFQVFDVLPGERVALVGPPGCGKTTVLRLAAGLQSAAPGVVTRRGRVAYVFHDGGLLSTWTVLENLVVPLVYRGVDERDAVQAAEQALERVHLANAAQRLPGQLHPAVRPWVQLARADASGAEVLLVEDVSAEIRGNSSMSWWEWWSASGRAMLCTIGTERAIAKIATRILSVPSAPGPAPTVETP